MMLRDHSWRARSSERVALVAGASGQLASVIGESWRDSLQLMRPSQGQTAEKYGAVGEVVNVDEPRW